MSTTGDVNITLQDGTAGVVQVPGQQVQVVMGCCSTGTAAQVVSTRSLATLSSTFGVGPMVEAAGLVVRAGGTVLAMRTATATAGAFVVSPVAAATVTAATNATPIVVTATAHGFSTGDVVTVASVTGNTNANGTWVITVLTANTFSLNNSAGNAAYVSGGTATFQGPVQTSTATLPGTCVVTMTGTPTDDLYPQIDVVAGGTIGTAGILFTVSLDAGRTPGPNIPLGTASTYAIAGTGITLNFSTNGTPYTLSVSTATNASPIAVTTTVAHGLTTGQTLAIASVTGNTAANGTWVITVTGATTFTLNGSTGNGAYVSGGTVQLLGTLAKGDRIRGATSAPLWNQTGINACFAALLASPFAVTGWGSMQIVGNATGADSTSFESGNANCLDTLASPNFIYTSAFIHARDARPPASFGGGAETDSTWTTAILSDYAATSNKRVLSCAGFYNMPSAFPTTVASTPRYRRPLSFALAAREVTIPPNRHAGRVKDGSLSQIVVDPVNDPLDGFVYHDERITGPVLDYQTGGTGRFTSARTRVGIGSAPGFFIVNPLTLAPLGSDFWMWPFRAVMDVACTIAHQVGQQQINDDLRTNSNGTLSDKDARAIQSAFYAAFDAQMTGVAMISGRSVQVDQTQNIQVTKTVVITITILAKAYVLQETVTIGFTNALAA